MQIKMLAILLFCKVKCLLLIFYILCKMNALRLYIVRLPIISALIDKIIVNSDYNLDIHFRITAQQYLGKAS